MDGLGFGMVMSVCRDFFSVGLDVWIEVAATEADGDCVERK